MGNDGEPAWYGGTVVIGIAWRKPMPVATLYASRKISITQRDLGNMVGMSRGSTNRQLRIWEDKKWVRLERNVVVILRPDRLAAIADDGAHNA